MNLNQNKKIFIVLFFLIFVIFWQWWLPGPKVSTDYPIVQIQTLKSQFDFPRIWSERGSEGLGEYTVFTLWSWPMSFLSGFLASINLGFSIQEKIEICIFFILSGVWGILSFLDDFDLSVWAKLVAALFYLTNGYILLLIDGGQISIAFAYAWFPTCYRLLSKSLFSGFRKQVLAGLSVAILGFFDIRFIYILALLVLVDFCYNFFLLGFREWKKLTVAWLKTSVVALIAVVGLHFYWLFPLIKNPISSETYLQLTGSSFLGFISLGHAILLLSPHWYKNIFGNITLLKIEFFLIPLLAFLAPILKPRNYKVLFWLIVALLSIFLVKGANEPLPTVYPWLYTHIPGFSLFRDPSKFFFLTALSYSVLIGFSLDTMIKNHHFSSRLRKIFLLLLLSYFIFINRPVWLGQMTGTFYHPFLQSEYSKLAAFLEGDKYFARVFWIPGTVPLTFTNQDHPITEAERLVKKRPFSVGVLGTYETFNFLREASFSGQLFDVSGIGYIAYPYLDTRRSDISRDNIAYYYTFLKQISHLPWVDGLVKESPIPLIKTKAYQDRIFMTSNYWWVVGSDDIYKETTTSSKLRLSNNGLIFADEYPGFSQTLENLENIKIVLNKKTFLDFIMSFIPTSKIIFPALNLGVSPDQSGWWKRDSIDLVAWRDFLNLKYGIENQDFELGGGWAIAEGSLKLNVKNNKFNAGDILYARVLESGKGGAIKFYQNQKIIGSIMTKTPSNNVRWFKIGELTSGVDDIKIETTGDINVVNALSAVSMGDMNKYTIQAEKFKNNILDFSEQNTQNYLLDIKYEKINSTEYRVKISGLKDPQLLVFSEIYDHNWSMNGQHPIPIYSLLNGFLITKDGNYIIKFSPQSYVDQGLVVSGLTLLVIIIIFAKPSFKLLFPMKKL